MSDTPEHPMSERAEHKHPDCAGDWMWWAACTEGHPGNLSCSECGAIIRATTERTDNALRDQIRILQRLVCCPDAQGAV